MCAAHQQYDEESDAALLEADTQPSTQRGVLWKALAFSSLLVAVALMSLELVASHRAGLPAKHDSLGSAAAARERVMLESDSVKKDTEVSETQTHNHTQVERNVSGSKETKMQMPSPSTSAHVVSTVLHINTHKNTHDNTQLERNVDDDQAKKMQLHSTSARVASKSPNITQDERNVSASEAKETQLPTPSTAAYVVSAVLFLFLVVLIAALSCCAMCVSIMLWSELEVTCSQVASACVAYAAGAPSSVKARLVIEVMLAAVQPVIILVSMVLYTRFGVDTLAPVQQVVILLVVTLRLVFADLAFMLERIRQNDQQQLKAAQIHGDEHQGDVSVAPMEAAHVAETQGTEGNATDALLPLLGKFQVLKNFVFSKAEAADVVTDAAAVVSVLHLQRSANFQLRLAAGWSQGPAALLLPMFERLTLCGAAALVLVLAICVQTISAGLVLTGTNEDAMMAEVAEGVGLGGFSGHVNGTSESPRKEDARYLRLIAKVLFEAAPQLVLQGSAVMAAGTGLRAQPVLAISLLFSAGMGCEKVWTMLDFVCREAKTTGDFLLLGAPAALSGLMIIWGVGRVFAAEQCASKIWNLSTGCVPFP
eukprot:TRINITY_DN2956_c0_g2_i1.p1 TRINITY_DN2956_c0_g2~~TRINITY_DN2956_c0_g2_i1.p1  ORF type:complete len:594 (+),score=130.83 TRINITY_DN2956_c0_g2_i1:63-1844(+)